MPPMVALLKASFLRDSCLVSSCKAISFGEEGECFVSVKEHEEFIFAEGLDSEGFAMTSDNGVFAGVSDFDNEDRAKFFEGALRCPGFGRAAVS